MKIVIGEKKQQSNYFELSYTFTLDVPQTQIGLESQATTKDITGIASYSNDVKIEDIQADLIARFNKAQTDFNTDTKLSLYGRTYDGTKWQ